jgi:DUF1680 family protein
MRKIVRIPVGLACAALLAPASAQTLEQPLQAVPATRVRLSDPFLAPRIKAGREVVLPACLKHCEETGRIRNFAVAAGREPGQHAGLLFDDSDVYKLIEGIAGALATEKDAALQARADAIIELIAAAQMPDGYLDTYYQLVEPSKRWKDLAGGHELYCAGHLFEAAVAYAQATGKERLLEVARKLADHIDHEFGPGKRQEPCGHPEVELALIRLARFTGEKRYAELARFFVDQRGQLEKRASFGEYAQDLQPLRAQTAPVGHAVRAMYLYSGALDVAQWFHDASLLPPLLAIWDELLRGHFYATGGIGSQAAIEGFGRAYDLPNDTAYCETCASIGMLLWNQRLLLATGKSVFADVCERELYNAIPAGLSLSGERFFYANPLLNRGEHERSGWFDCACCPTNLARTLPTLAQYAYATGPNALYVVLYGKSRADVELAGTRVTVTQSTEMPWKGHIEIAVEPERPARFALYLRIPGWAAGHSVVAPPLPAGVPVESFLPRDVQGAGTHWKVLEREWKRGDRLSLDLDLDVQRLHADPKVEADVGRVALQRGPLVYCCEGLDNGGHARGLVLEPTVLDIQAAWRADLLGGTQVLTAKCERLRDSDPFHYISEPAEMVAIPYALWANRGASDMQVWIAEQPSAPCTPARACAWRAGRAGSCAPRTGTRARRWRRSTTACSGRARPTRTARASPSGPSAAPRERARNGSSSRCASRRRCAAWPCSGSTTAGVAVAAFPRAGARWCRARTAGSHCRRPRAATASSRTRCSPCSSRPCAPRPCAWRSSSRRASRPACSSGAWTRRRERARAARARTLPVRDLELVGEGLDRAFYPPGTKPGEMLAYYATQLGTVELDASYYRIPARAMVQGWRAKTPGDFVMSAKFPRSIVHGGDSERVDAERVLTATTRAATRTPSST